MASPSSTGDVTATAVAPLTTKFTPASSCLLDLYLEITADQGGQSIPGGYSWIHLGPTTSKAACVPSGWAPEAYYSPGICPADYTLGCDASTHTIGKSSTEYRATCCPTGYACRDASDTFLYPWATIDPCTVRDLTTTTAIVTYSANTAAPATLALSITNYYQALGVSIRWQKSDSLPVQTGSPTATTTAPTTTSTAQITITTTTTTGHSISTTSTTTTSHTTSTTESSSLVAPPVSAETHSSLPVSDSSSSSGLSTGAKAGVGVGVAIAGVLIIFAAVFFFYVRPRRNKNMSQNAWNREKKTELDALPVYPSSHELASRTVNELEGNPRHIPQEMDASSNGRRK